LLDLEYRHVDVFSRRALAGNGLVVVLDAADLPGAVMQEVTREVRQFETAFLADVNLIVPVRGGLEQARISHPRFEKLLAASGAKFVYVLDPDRPEGRTWDNAGRVEDVATGSAAGPAAGYLMHHGVRPRGEPFLIHQGQFTGRPSTIEIRPGPDGRLWVGGPVAPVASGRFHARLT
jgi:predicted PhzF superfamily epimerase YddE/YHI9